MESPDRKIDHGVIQSLLHAERLFEFFQAVTLLEHGFPDRVSVGYDGPGHREAVRLRPDTDTGFPASEIKEVETIPAFRGGGEQFRLTTTFMGLYGVDTPLPLHYASYFCRLDHDEEHVRDFLDIIHHRVLSLFYRSWKKYRYYITYRPGGDDPVSRYLLCLAGLEPILKKTDTAVPAIRYVRYSGLLTQKPHSGAGLAGILRDFYDPFPVEVTPCVTQWIAVPENQCNRMGNRNCRTGLDLTVGERIYDRRCAFRVTVGPLRLWDYTSFLPEGPCYAQAKELVRLYVVDPLLFQLKVGLCREDVPRTQLSGDGEGARLGWASWLISDHSEDDQYVTFTMPW